MRSLLGTPQASFTVPRRAEPTWSTLRGQLLAWRIATVRLGERVERAS